MELEVSEDAPGGDEGAGHAGQDPPDAEVAGASRLRRARRLFDQLTVELVPQGAELLARLQDPLDDGHRVGHALQVLQRAEDFEGFALQRGVAPAPCGWRKHRQSTSPQSPTRRSACCRVPERRRPGPAWTLPTLASDWSGLTGQVDVAVGQRQQRRVKRVVAVAEDGVPLVDLLHHLRVQAVLLQRGGGSTTPQTSHADDVITQRAS